MSDKLISILDTHRLPYKNAVITAKNLSSATIHFFDASDNDVGEQVYTNSAGYICDNNGALYSGGVFVKEDATIKAVFDNGANTAWNCLAQFRTEIGEGKLIGKARGGSDLDKQELFNANQSIDTELWYGNILGLPVINSWAESDQIVLMTQPNDSVAVDKFAKTLVIGVKGGVSIDDSNGWSLTLTPDQLRFGQNIAVVNLTQYRLTLKNTDGKPFAFVNASGDDNVTMITLGGAVDRKFRNAVDTQMLHVLTKTITSNVLVVVDDLTPDVLVLHIPYTATAFQDIANTAYIEFDNKCTFRRIIKVALINDATHGGANVRCHDTGTTSHCLLESGQFSALLFPGKANRDDGDYVISPVYGAKPVHPYLAQTFDYATAEAGDPLKLHVPLGVEYIYWTATVESEVIFYLDSVSDRRIACNIGNASANIMTFRFRLPDEEELGYVLVEPGESKLIVFEQFGNRMCFLKGADNKFHPVKGTGSVMEFLCVREDTEYAVNIEAFCSRYSVLLGNTFNIYIPVFNGTKRLTFDIASIIRSHGNNNFSIVLKMGGVTGDVTLLTVTPTDMGGGANYLTLANHTRVQATLTCNGATLSGTVVAIP
jgi:hypothetical protein